MRLRLLHCQFDFSQRPSFSAQNAHLLITENKHTEDNSGAQHPGAEYVNVSSPSRMEQGILPVAVPIEAEVVCAPMQTQQYTKTTSITHYAAPPRQNPSTHQAREIYTPSFRRRPVVLGACPHCGTGNIRTHIRTFPSIFTWLACLVLLLLFWPLCWVPLVCDVCKQTDHYCNSCQAKVGETNPFSDCCEKHRG